MSLFNSEDFKKSIVNIGKDLAVEFVKSQLTSETSSSNPEINKKLDVIIEKEKKNEDLLSSIENILSLIIVTILAINFKYYILFDSSLINTFINMIYGLIVFILPLLFILDKKDKIKNLSSFYKFLIYSLLIISIINAIYRFSLSFSIIYNL